jgi:hypothetical protein
MWAAVRSGRPDLKPLRVRAQPSGSRLQRSVSSVAVQAAAIDDGGGGLEQLLRVHDFPAAEVGLGELWAVMPACISCGWSQPPGFGLRTAWLA